MPQTLSLFCDTFQGGRPSSSGHVAVQTQNSFHATPFDAVDAITAQSVQHCDDKLHRLRRHSSRGRCFAPFCWQGSRSQDLQRSFRRSTKAWQDGNASVPLVARRRFSKGTHSINCLSTQLLRSRLRHNGRTGPLTTLPWAWVMKPYLAHRRVQRVNIISVVRLSCLAGSRCSRVTDIHCVNLVAFLPLGGSFARCRELCVPDINLLKEGFLVRPCHEIGLCCFCFCLSALSRLGLSFFFVFAFISLFIPR